MSKTSRFKTRAKTKAKELATPKNIAIAIAIIVAIWLLIKGGKKLLSLIRDKRLENSQSKPEYKLAQQYRAAANPSGSKFWINWDGTKEKEIEDLIPQTKGKFKQVSQAYKDLFKDDLTRRMRKELSSRRFKEWQSVIG